MALATRLLATCAHKDLRNDMTIVSGSSHPRVTGGIQRKAASFLPARTLEAYTGRNTISLDQLMAKHLGHETRFPSLVLNTGGSTSPSYTGNGAMILPRRTLANCLQSCL